MGSIRYALIGCGRVSRSHIRAAKNNNLDICALCDADPAAVWENLGAAGVEGIPLYRDYKDMLREARPALVAIATPSGLHAQMAIDCMAAGAHVIIEKPMAISMADARKVAAMAEQSGLCAGVSLQNRFNPVSLELRRAVEAGRFGRIYSASLRLCWHRGQGYYDQAAWRGTKALDGGAMMNQSIHGIDLLNWMMNDTPEEITAFTGTLARDIEAEDIGMALLRYPGGALASLECTTLRHPGAEQGVIEINGERGCVRLGGTAAHVVELWRFDDAPPGEEDDMRRRFGVNPETVYGHGHSLFYADMLDAIARGRQPLVHAREGMKALEIILGAYESARVGAAVRLPLKSIE